MRRRLLRLHYDGGGWTAASLPPADRSTRWRLQRIETLWAGRGEREWLLHWTERNGPPSGLRRATTTFTPCQLTAPRSLVVTETGDTCCISDGSNSSPQMQTPVSPDLHTVSEHRRGDLRLHLTIQRKVDAARQLRGRAATWRPTGVSRWSVRASKQVLRTCRSVGRDGRPSYRPGPDSSRSDLAWHRPRSGAVREHRVWKVWANGRMTFLDESAPAGRSSTVTGTDWDWWTVKSHHRDPAAPCWGGGAATSGGRRGRDDPPQRA